MRWILAVASSDLPAVRGSGAILLGAEMADVFISYSRADRLIAQYVADAMTDEGWSVWWDRDLSAGESFRHVIEVQLESARAVVVIWSNASVTSRWVVDEATEALKRNVLFPIAVGDARPPLGFRHLHTVVMSTTEPADLYAAVKECIAAIAKSFGVSQSAAVTSPDPLASIRRRLLAAHAYHDLRALQAEMEVFQATHPPSAEANVLQRQIAAALHPPPAAMYPSASAPAPMHACSRFITGVMMLLALLGVIYVGWKLVEYFAK